MTSRVPLKWKGEIVGWATPGEFDPYEQSYELKDVEWLPEDKLPKEARTLIRLANEAMLKGLTTNED